MADISNYADMIQARDIDARIDEIESEIEFTVEAAVAFDFDSPFTGVSEDDREELKVLRKVRAQLDTVHGGDTLISDGYFKTYVQEYAEEQNSISSAAWPFNCIDWDRAVSDFQSDYTSIDFDGETYWTQ